MLSGFFPDGRVEAYRCSPFKARIDLVGQQLVEQRYLDVVTAQHVREWLRFGRYLADHGRPWPESCRVETVQRYVTERLRTFSSASRARFVRASLRILIEADHTGHFRRRAGAVPRPAPAWVACALQEFVTYLIRHRGAAPRTVAKRAWHVARFAEFLEAQGITTLGRIAPGHLQAFLAQLTGQAPVTRSSYATTLRSFLQWAFVAELVPRDLREAVTAPRRFRQRDVRDTLTDAEVTRVLAAVDRASPTGRRDYAVLMLAACYGLRPCDIRHLRLEHLGWRDGTISFPQVKTGRVLSLPLMPAVQAALIAYLQAGRPATASRHVFVRHRAPYEPFVEANNLAALMRQALQRAGLHTRHGRRGLYLFRHTLARRLLTAGCSLKHIGDVLGHATTETTMEYASIDLTALRRVALSAEEVHP
jgi:site-specific recombinase XerD